MPFIAPPWLVVEDAEPLAASLQRGLIEEGFGVEIATTADAALSRMARTTTF